MVSMFQKWGCWRKKLSSPFSFYQKNLVYLVRFPRNSHVILLMYRAWSWGVECLGAKKSSDWLQCTEISFHDHPLQHIAVHYLVTAHHGHFTLDLRAGVTSEMLFKRWDKRRRKEGRNRKKEKKEREKKKIGKREENREIGVWKRETVIIFNPV